MSAYDSPEVERLMTATSRGPVSMTPALLAEVDQHLAQESLSNRDRGRLLARRVAASHGRDDPEVLLPMIEEAVDLLEPSDDPSMLYAVAVGAGIHAQLGNHGRSLEYLLRLAARDDLTPRVKNNFGVTLLGFGAVGMAGQMAAEVVQHGLESGDATFVYVGAINVLMAVMRSDTIPATSSFGADRLLNTAEDALQRLEAGELGPLSPPVEQIARLLSAHVALFRGDIERAAELWGDTQSFLLDADHNLSIYLGEVEARIAMGLGDFERARSLVEKCLASGFTVSTTPLAGLALELLMSQIEEARGDHVAATAAARRASQFALTRTIQPGILIQHMARWVELEQQQADLLDRTRRLSEQALVDDLSGVANRRALDLRLAKLAAEGDESVALIVADVDRFKELNDQHGHAVGDLALRAIGQLLSATCRSDDLVARFGGEEFVIVPASASIEDGRALAERIRQAFLDRDWTQDGLPASAAGVTCSLGVAAGRAAQVADVLERADKAMYAAKRAGRDAVVVDRSR